MRPIQSGILQLENIIDIITYCLSSNKSLSDATQ